MTDSFNVEIYRQRVSPHVDNEDDLKFVCNAFGKMYQDIDDPCTDNFRISKLVDGKYSSDYEKALEKGCCGSEEYLPTYQ